jgi:hypothetical protein
MNRSRIDDSPKSHRKKRSNGLTSTSAKFDSFRIRHLESQVKLPFSIHPGEKRICKDRAGTNPIVDNHGTSASSGPGNEGKANPARRQSAVAQSQSGK